MKNIKKEPWTDKGSRGTDPPILRTLAATGLEKGTGTDQRKGETDLKTEGTVLRIGETDLEIEEAGGTDQGNEETDPGTEGHEAGKELETGDGIALTLARAAAAAAAVAAAAGVIKFITCTGSS